MKRKLDSVKERHETTHMAHKNVRVTNFYFTA